MCIVVDNWDEVCRQNTDIENMSIKVGLTKGENPMGMAVFDIAGAGLYYERAVKLNIGFK